MAKHSLFLLELARKGAAHRFREIQAELAALFKAFPHLRYGSAVSPAMPDAVEEPKVRRRRGRRAATQAETTNGRRRRRGKLSAAGRAAISAAQKKRWAAVKRKKAASKS